MFRLSVEGSQNIWFHFTKWSSQFALIFYLLKFSSLARFWLIVMKCLVKMLICGIKILHFVKPYFTKINIGIGHKCNTNWYNLNIWPSSKIHQALYLYHCCVLLLQFSLLTCSLIQQISIWMQWIWITVRDTQTQTNLLIFIQIMDQRSQPKLQPLHSPLVESLK